MVGVGAHLQRGDREGAEEVGRVHQEEGVLGKHSQLQEVEKE